MLSTTVARLTYNGTGTSNTYAFPYYFRLASDLKVYVDGALKTLNTHYTVLGAGDSSGGSITGTFTSGTANVVIIRDPPIKQEVDLVDNSKLPAASLETGLDVMTAVDQRLKDLVDRSFGLSDSYATSVITRIAPVADKILGFDSSGNLTSYALTSNPTDSNSISFTPSGTGAVPTTVQSRLRQFIYVSDFGAVGNGTADDTTALQAAIDACVTLGGVLIFDYKKEYKITSRITIDLSNISIEGNHAHIYVAFTGDWGIKWTGSVSSPWKQDQQTRFVRNLTVTPVIKSGWAAQTTKVASTKGWLFDSTSGGTAGANRILFTGCINRFFAEPFESRNNSYCNTFEHCTFGVGGKPLYFPSSYTNTGERWSFNNCIFDNSDNWIDIDHPDTDVYFNCCSFDYNSKVIRVNQGRAFIYNPHIEASLYSAIPIQCENTNGARISIVGGTFLCIGTNTVSIFNALNATNGGGIYVNDMHLQNAMVNNDTYLTSGSGHFSITNHSCLQTPQNPRLISAASNKMLDGGFESGVADAFVYRDTAAITSRTTGTNLSISSSVTYARTGSKSMKLTKVGASGTTAAVLIYVPITKDNAAFQDRLYYKKAGSQTGTMYISRYFASMIDSPTAPLVNLISNLTKTANASLEDTTVVFTSAAVDWTVAQSSGQFVRAPKWANYYVIQINCDSVNAGDLYFDDVEIAEW